MRIAKLNALKAWQLILALVGLGVVTALVVWALVWVMWAIRPLLAAAVALTVVGWVLYSLHRYRRGREWSDEEWLGS
jgi:hypothetical protein